MLRYPGGKTRAIKVLDAYLPKDIKVLVSPFFGGGSFEYHCTKKGIVVHGYDLFDPLVNFWRVVKQNPQQLHAMVLENLPITKEKFVEMQKQAVSLERTDIERASAFLIINRCSFSGTSMSGGFSAESARTRITENIINKLLSYDMSKMSVELAGFTESIPKHPDDFLFLDPPYYLQNKSKLYGKKGDLHAKFDHEGLFKILSTRQNWMLCYNKCDWVTDRYKDFAIIDVQWSYGMSKSKESSEVLIFSNDRAPIEDNI